MTVELKAVIAKLEQLSKQEQIQYASVLEEMLVAVANWADLFEKSSDTLSTLADEAIAAFERGETRPLDDLLNEGP